MGLTSLTKEQENFLEPMLPEYLVINNGSKIYTPFWAKLQKAWGQKYSDLATLFPGREESSLTTEESKLLTDAINKTLKVCILTFKRVVLRVSRSLLMYLNRNSKIGIVGVLNLAQLLVEGAARQTMVVYCLQQWVRSARRKQKMFTPRCTGKIIFKRRWKRSTADLE